MKVIGSNVTVVMTFVGNLFLLTAGCGDVPSDNGPAVAGGGAEASGSGQEASEPADVSISLGGAVQEATTQITRTQAEWLRSARQRARERLQAGQPAIRETPPEAGSIGGQNVITSALTTGSVNWSDCQNLDWFLVTSGSDGSGRIFCAKLSNTGFQSLLIGGGNSFVPRWFDSATAAPGVVFNICHNNAMGLCQLTQCCFNGSCAGVVQSFFQNSGRGNISPPADTKVIEAQAGIIVC